MWERRVTCSQLGLGTLVLQIGLGGGHALGLLSPGDLGHPAGTGYGKKASAPPYQGPALLSTALTPRVQERGQIHQRGLTQSHSCLC